MDLRQQLFLHLYFNRRKAHLARADLSYLDLRGANLGGAMITGQQFAAALSLVGTVLPDGTIWDKFSTM